MIESRLARIVGSLALIGALGSVALAQNPADSQPAAAPLPPSAPADREAITARVIDVRGDVQHAALGGSDWQACKLNDEYPGETKIRTGIRASIKFQIGAEEPYTAIVVESVGLVMLSELYKTRESKRVRVGVGYGKVRAGVAEGGLQSDFTVDSPVATLSKRGTWDFGMSYERATERFEVFVHDRGLVDALNAVTGERRQVLSGQAVTEAMRRWADEAQLRNNVPIGDVLGQSDTLVAYSGMSNSGLGVLAPGNGSSVSAGLSNASASPGFGALARSNLPPASVIRLGQAAGPGGPFVRDEGFFGTGRGDDLIDFVVNPNSALVKHGLAPAGSYQLRRSVARALIGSAAGRR